MKYFALALVLSGVAIAFAYESNQNSQVAAERIRGQAAELNRSLRLESDELEVKNAQIESDIAVLKRNAKAHKAARKAEDEAINRTIGTSGCGDDILKASDGCLSRIAH